MIRHREEVLERQLEQERLSWAAMEIFASACVLSRLDAELQHGTEADRPVAIAFLESSLREIDSQLRELGDSLDPILLAAAQQTCSSK